MVSHSSTLKAVITEVEATCPIIYVSDDISDPEPLTQAHLLHGRRLTRLRSTIEKVNNPSYLDADQLRRDAKKQSVLLEHLINRWRHEYLTS